MRGTFFSPLFRGTHRRQRGEAEALRRARDRGVVVVHHGDRLRPGLVRQERHPVHLRHVQLQPSVSFCICFCRKLNHDFLKYMYYVCVNLPTTCIPFKRVRA